METYSEQRKREYNTITPGPWKWVFLGNAGNYFLLGNDGKGPVTNSGPDSADGKLMQAAPELLEAVRLITSKLRGLPPLEITGEDAIIHLEFKAAEVEAIRGALAKAEGNDGN